MKAKEMFEKLGFKLEEENDEYIAYGYRGNVEDCFVCFALPQQYFQCFYNKKDVSVSQPLEVDYKLYKAINKQIKELGWK